jgi:hypothetical protein
MFGEPPQRAGIDVTRPGDGAQVRDPDLPAGGEATCPGEEQKQVRPRIVPCRLQQIAPGPGELRLIQRLEAKGAGDQGSAVGQGVQALQQGEQRRPPVASGLRQPWADLDQTGETYRALSDGYLHAAQRRHLAALDIDLQEIDLAAHPPPVVEADDLDHAGAAVHRRAEPVVAGIVEAQRQAGLSMAIQEPCLLEPNVAAAVEDAVGLEQLEIVALRLEREDLALLPDELRRQDGEIADMGADVDDAITRPRSMDQEGRLRRFPNPLLADGCADDRVAGRGEQAEATDSRQAQPRQVPLPLSVAHVPARPARRPAAAVA